MARAATLRREDRAIARVAISNVRTDLLKQAIPGPTGTVLAGSTGCSSAGGASFEDAGSLAEVSRGRAAPEAAAVGPQAGMSRQPPCCQGWLLGLPDLW